MIITGIYIGFIIILILWVLVRIIGLYHEEKRAKRDFERKRYEEISRSAVIPQRWGER